MTGLVLAVRIEGLEFVLGIYFVLLHTNTHTHQCKIVLRLFFSFHINNKYMIRLSGHRNNMFECIHNIQHVKQSNYMYNFMQLPSSS